MFKFLKKDSFWLGLAVGTILPLIITAIIYFIVISFPNSETGLQVLRNSTVFILGIVPNALLLRYYLVNLKADKTGRGILIMTFVFGIIYFILFYNNRF